MEEAVAVLLLDLISSTPSSHALQAMPGKTNINIPAR